MTTVIESDCSDFSSDEFDDAYVFEDVADGNFTKRLNSMRVGGLGPNSQVTLGSLNLSSKGMRSGENQIQLHLDSSGDRKGKRSKDRSDRATVEQVLDPRTRLILFRLVQRGFFDRIEGCVSTGKEANVYHAVDGEGGSLAVKIYKTSILTFKDRDRYVTGEFRYRNGYSRHNPRKMVATWAEKEMRNLQRMHQAGLPVPKSRLLKSHVLVMDFVGSNGWPAPLLKHAVFDRELANKLYLDMVKYVKILYNQCKLVHADLSEYNILFHDNALVIIDVSQSVEHDHPHSLQFLRSDITNVTRFFNEKGAAVLPPRRLFELIVDPNCQSDEEMQKMLDNERVEILTDSEYLFLNVFIPHKLDSIVNFERDDEMEKKGTELNNPFQKIIAKTVIVNEDEEHSESGEDEEEVEEEDSDSEDSGEKVPFTQRHQKYVRVKGETTEDKKNRKKAVQEEKKEKRAVKIPKHVKKRKQKLRVHR
ncbi:unnamed protein product [Bursaphelenchus okinawaensis]|uniref:Serine/threonine-protein kinase RIO1 n=1 Tax=Bursaphelenchus okinawaensis TaxID=465554 RepID=A0A811JTV7_9BILA|nr:unnamed protein product [Bursaphelenchus okinawaensis]CAG9083011.1 unnamed protein product [Bursaphelenchus okinawaensis]